MPFPSLEIMGFSSAVFTLAFAAQVMIIMSSVHAFGPLPPGVNSTSSWNQFSFHLWNAAGTAYQSWRMSAHKCTNNRQIQTGTKWNFTTADSALFGMFDPVIGQDGTVYSGVNDNILSVVYALNGETGSLKWTYTLPGNASFALSGGSFAIGADGSIYLSCRFGVLCLDGQTGSFKWNLNIGGVNSGRNLAIGVDGTVYAYGLLFSYEFAYINVLSAIDGHSGKIKWQFYNEHNLDYSNPSLGADGTVYISVNWDEKGSFWIDNFVGLLALDGQTGMEKWKFIFLSSKELQSDYTYSDPAIGPTGDIYVLVDDTLYAISSAGVQLWVFNYTSFHVGTPAFGADGNIFYICNLAIGPDGTVYVPYEFAMYAISSAGNLKWRTNIANGYVPKTAPIISADGTVYLGATDGYMYALNGQTGVIYGKEYCGEYVSNPVIGLNGTIYLSSGNLIALFC